MSFIYLSFSFTCTYSNWFLYYDNCILSSPIYFSFICSLFYNYLLALSTFLFFNFSYNYCFSFSILFILFCSNLNFKSNDFNFYSCSLYLAFSVLNSYYFVSIGFYAFLWFFYEFKVKFAVTFLFINELD